MTASDYPSPYPLQFKGSALSRWLMQLLGWRLDFSGLPALQGVAIIYPHTSNWDFLILVLAKWALGIQARFWAKDSLFHVPLFGAWLRWLGGVPVERTSSHGTVLQTASLIGQAKQNNTYYWLAVAPEGTRKRLPGWRSGFYRTALQADVPLALVRLDYQRKEVKLSDFIRLTGDEHLDMQRIAEAFEGVKGLRPEKASPIGLLDSSVLRADTIGK